MSRETRTALLQLLVAELLIGSVGVFVHESGQNPITAVLFRCVFGSLFLLVWGGARGLFRGLAAERALIRSAIVSGVLLVLNWVALFAGMARSSIGVATMVYHFFPFVILGLAALFYGERTRAADIGWTAVEAYLQLERQGLVEARPRSGYYVRATAPSPPRESAARLART